MLTHTTVIVLDLLRIMQCNNPVDQTLEQHSSLTWIRCKCGLPNFASSLFTSGSVEISNSFSSLGSTDDSDQICNSPLATSSPQHPVAKSTKNSNTTTNGVKEIRGTIDSQSKYSKKDKQIPRKPYKPMKALVINFQSIRNKKAELATCLEVDDPDVLIGTETWLDDSINSCEIFPSNYSIFRKDRQTNAKGTAHGGVLIAVKSNFVCTQMHELDSENESVWIEMEVNGTKPILVGSFYRPPSTSKEHLNSLKDSLGIKVNMNHYSNIWLAGDFNLGDII